MQWKYLPFRTSDFQKKQFPLLARMNYKNHTSAHMNSNCTWNFNLIKHLTLNSGIKRRKKKKVQCLHYLGKVHLPFGHLLYHTMLNSGMSNLIRTYTWTSTNLSCKHRHDFQFRWPSLPGSPCLPPMWLVKPCNFFYQKSPDSKDLSLQTVMGANHMTA